MNPINKITDYVSTDYCEQSVLKRWITELSSENFCACMHSKFLCEASSGRTKHEIDNPLIVILQDTESVFACGKSSEHLMPVGIVLEMVGFEKNDKMYRSKKDGKYHSKFFIRPVWDIKKISEMLTYPTEPVCPEGFDSCAGISFKMSLDNNMFLDLQPGVTLDNDKLISVLQNFSYERSKIWKSRVMAAYDSIASEVQKKIDGTYSCR